MRNIVEYPVTADEVVEVLRKIQKEELEKIKIGGHENIEIGGLRGISLLLLEQYIMQYPKMFNTFSQAAMQVIAEKKDD